jgi:hypothetical protein
MRRPYHFLIVPKRLALSRLQILWQRLDQIAKPTSVSMLLSTIADLSRSKAELLGENAMLRQQLIGLCQNPDHRVA